jgi:hypothetical protein
MTYNHDWERKFLTRLDVLGNLKDGWHDGKGKATTKTAVVIAKKMCELFPKYIAHTVLFPTEEGGLIFESNDMEQELYIEISPYGSILLNDDISFDGHNFWTKKKSIQITNNFFKNNFKISKVE